MYDVGDDDLKEQHPIAPRLIIVMVCQNRIYTPYVTVCFVFSLTKMSYIYTVNDRMFGVFPDKNVVYIHRM